MTPNEPEKTVQTKVPPIVEHDRRYQALLAQKPARDWTREDMLRVGYSDADIDVILAKRPQMPLDHAPRKLTAAELGANLRYRKALRGYKAEWTERTWEATFPNFFEEWSIDGRINFPAPDHQGKVSADKFMQRMIENWFNSDDYNTDHLAKFIWLVNDQLHREGKKCWHCGPLDQFHDEISEAAHQEYMREKGGRKPGARTWCAKKIRDVLGCGERNAYRILAHGTALLWQRKKLAAAFDDDPGRNLPIHWDLRSGRRGRGRPTPYSLRAYCLGWVDAFEEIGQALEILRKAYARGLLADYYPTLPELIRGLDTEGIKLDARDVLAVWESFQRWRRDQLAKQASISFLQGNNIARIQE